MRHLGIYIDNFIEVFKYLSLHNKHGIYLNINVYVEYAIKQIIVLIKINYSLNCHNFEISNVGRTFWQRKYACV